MVFLDITRYRPRVNDATAFDLVMQVAEGGADVGEIAVRLRITS